MSSNLTPSAILTQAEAAWLAGYIDGDGCICLHNTGKLHKSVTLVIDSADGEILAYVQQLLGGHLVVKKKYQAHHRQAWSWRLKGMEKVRSVLAQIYPYLRCSAKRERARMIVEEWKAVTPRNGSYTPALLAQKEDFERRFLAIGSGRGKRAKENLNRG